MKRLKPILFTALLALISQAAAESVIVSDHLPINVRAPGPEDRIVAAARSGERLTVLDKQPGYLKVRTAKGEEGWVLSRFTQSEPVARERLAAAEQARDQAASQREELATQLAELSGAHEALQAEHAVVSDRAQALASELEQVKTAAASTLEIQQANEQLRQELTQLQEDKRAIQLELDTQDSRRSALILGAGILLAGLLLGLIIPYLRPRRSGWSDF